MSKKATGLDNAKAILDVEVSRLRKKQRTPEGLTVAERSQLLEMIDRLEKMEHNRTSLAVHALTGRKGIQHLTAVEFEKLLELLSR